MSDHTEPAAFTEHADELQWRGIYRDWALAGWKQAMEGAADIADGHASVEGIAQRIAAAIRASASLRKESGNV